VSEVSPLTKDVLFLLPIDASRFGVLKALQAIEAELRKSDPETIFLHTESLVPRPGLEAGSRTVLGEKYTGMRFSMVS
jgi:hypothetical protein